MPGFSTAEKEIKHTEIQQINMQSFKHVLKNPNFLFLWISQLLSLTALNAANFGLILLVQSTTNSLILVSLAIIAFQLPAFPFGMVAGVIVDWFDKRQILWISHVLRMFTMLLMCISLLISQNMLWPLFILIFLTALIGQFFMPAEGASIPLLVDKQDLLAAFSLCNITLSLSMIIGFLLLGGLLVEIFPPFTLSIGSLTLHIQSIDMIFFIDFLMYGVCTLLIFLIPQVSFHSKRNIAMYEDNESKPKPSSFKTMLAKLWHDLVEGWTIVNKKQELFFSVIQLSVIGIVMLLIGLLAPTLVQQYLHHRAQDVPIILAPAGFGLVGMAIFMPHLSKHIEKKRLMTIGMFTLAIGFLLLPVSHWLAVFLDPKQGEKSSWLLLATILLALTIGAAISLLNITTQTMMIEASPEEGRARVLSLQLMIYSVGSIPILLFAAGIAQLLGFGRLMVLVSVTLVLFYCWGLSYMSKTKRNQK